MSDTRLPYMAVAFAINAQRDAAQERQREHRPVGPCEALDALAQDLAKRLHPNERTAFLRHSGTST